MRSVKEMDPNASCIVLSTCNRTELWFYNLTPDPLDYLFSQLPHIKNSGRELFVRRSGTEAVSYLMEMTSGLHSQILGEDQIVSQVREALNRARECCKPDPVLDTLFRMAVTAAKKSQKRKPGSEAGTPLCRNGPFRFWKTDTAH